MIIEEETARKFGYEEVNVVPQPKAGGSFATAAYHAFAHPTAVEHIKASAGMDIGDTLIGMHLRDVAVPVRISRSRLAVPMWYARGPEPSLSAVSGRFMMKIGYSVDAEDCGSTQCREIWYQMGQKFLTPTA